VYAFVLLVLRDRFLNVEMEMVLRDILMVAFFTSVGMSASLRLLREGGKQVLLFFGLATLGVVLQVIVGVTLARVMRIDLLVGLICGAVSLTGGPATALAFGKTFEELGLEGATTVGIAAAMVGIVSGGLLGGLVGGRLIEKKGLRPAAGQPNAGLARAEAIAHAGETTDPTADESPAERASLMNNVIAISVAMGIGTLISMGLERMGLILPAYIGAMMLAAVIRNLNDRFRFAHIAQHQVDEIGNISLNIFIVMALLTLRLWELVHLALPMLLILAAQLALNWIVSVGLSFRLMGRDYEAAVTATGYYGFMMGTMANAFACMDVLIQKYGPAPRSIIVVSLVGAFLIDFTNALIITVMTNVIR
jgi:ESS family glutamate:Na+ symporter